MLSNSEKSFLPGEHWIINCAQVFAACGAYTVDKKLKESGQKPVGDPTALSR